MSRDVFNAGFMAVLLNPIPKEDREDLSEALCDAKSILSINYAGTIVYSREQKDDENVYGLTFGMMSGSEAFVAATIQHKLPINMATIVPYQCIWYNGADNPVDELTVWQFLKQTGQER